MKKLFAFIIVVFLALPFFAMEKKYTRIPFDTSKDMVINLFTSYGWTVNLEGNSCVFKKNDKTKLNYFGYPIQQVTCIFDKMDRLICQSINIETSFTEVVFQWLFTVASFEQVHLDSADMEDKSDGCTAFRYFALKDDTSIMYYAYGKEHTYLAMLTYYKNREFN